MKFFELNKKHNYLIFSIFNKPRALFFSIRYKMFLKRNLLENARVFIYGLHYMKPKCIPVRLRKLFLHIIWMKEFLSYFLLGNLNIPQLEVVITTHCTLHCKHCTNYIPYIEKSEHFELKYEDFKLQIDNLLNSVHSLQNLILLGGEPLLAKDLTKIFEYAANQKKIKNIWIVTNATMFPSEELITLIKKYKKKTIVWISNYSGNKEITPILKSNEIIDILKSNNIQYRYDKALKWNYVQLYKKNNRSNEKNIAYFKKCLHKCSSLINGYINVCPRAGTFMLKNMLKGRNIELVNLNISDKNVLTEQLLEFYSRDFFSACDYCNRNEDILHEKITPAIQLKTKGEIC